MKIGIAGAGPLGATAAYALALRGVGREIVLVDADWARSAAEAEDVLQAVPFAEPLIVRAGDMGDLSGASVVIVAAADAPSQPLEDSANVFREVIPAILQAAPYAVLIVATSPVDVLTHLADQIARQHGLPWGRVLGTGTLVDTARFRALLAGRLGVDPAQVYANVLGEHGPAEVLAWPLVSVGGLPLPTFLDRAGLDLGEADRAAIDDTVRGAADRILGGKGTAHYGIGGAIARLVDMVLNDDRAVLTICAPQAEVLGVRDVTLSLPHLVGGAGAIEPLAIALPDAEMDALRRSAERVRAALARLGL